MENNAKAELLEHLKSEYGPQEGQRLFDELQAATKAELLEQYVRSYGPIVGQQLFDELEAADGDIKKEHDAITKAEQTIKRNENHSHHFNEVDEIYCN
ncbi:MAG: hypothetical protein WCP93_04265 [Candidatus Berkelbacteria bacterium]